MIMAAIGGQSVAVQAGPLAGVRVLYFYQYFTTPKGSYSTRVYEFTRRWVRSGAKVTVVTSAYDKSDLRPTRMIEKLNIEGVDVRIFNIKLSNRHGFFLRLLTFAGYSLMACWYALTLPADVVVASSGPITVGLPGLAARLLRGRPLIFEVRDLWPEGAVQLGVLRNPLFIGLARAFERLCYAGATKIVALSEGMAQWIEKRYGYRDIEVVPNASDNEMAAATSGPSKLPAWARGKKLALYTGALGMANDCEQILQMARVLEGWGETDIEIVIAGDGKERPELERRARTLGLDHVRFLGGISKEEVMGWLRIAFCALFVAKDLRYVDTASPNKVFDAFAAGAPVLQTTQGWIKDLLARERCGITAPPYHAEKQARALVELANDASLRAELSENALRVAREQFDRGLLAHKMAGILASAAQSK